MNNILKLYRKIYDVFFYNPWDVVKKNKNILVDSTSILLDSVAFNLNTNNKINIGKDSMLGCSIMFESNKGEISVGDRTFINSGTKLISRSKIEIGSDVVIAWGCTIYDHNSHSLNYLDRMNDVHVQNINYRNGRAIIADKNWDVVKSKPIIIKDKVWIGFDSVILNGVTIGEGAIIGARSVVRDDVEPWTVWAGNPAKMVKRLKQQ